VTDDPRWPRAKAWLAGDHEPEPVAHLGVVGVPLGLGSVTPSRCDLTPAAVRDALGRFSTWDEPEAHAGTERPEPWKGFDLRSIAARDLGDLDVSELEPADAFEPIRDGAARGLGGADAVALLGGNNAITRPGVHALGLPLERVGLLTFDAHFDLRDTGEGLGNGNPVRALLEDGLPGKNVWQIGIQPFANSSAYHEVAHEAGVSFVTADQARRDGVEEVVSRALTQLSFEGVEAIYVDLDLDVLDRASAPACAGSRPGGLNPMEMRAAARLCGRFGLVRAVDLVEVDPEKDVADMTVLAAASLLLAFAAGLAGRAPTA